MRATLRMALVLAVGAFGAVLPAVANAEGAKYVAMGDSYTAAPGVQPQQTTSPGRECGRSEANYPHLVAAALKLSLTDVSCGGAKTEDFFVEQLPGQLPQFDALSAETEIVTVGMGGNDKNLFETLVVGCTETDFGKPNKGAPCKQKFSEFVTKTFEETRGPQEEALADIHVLAPKAKVFVVGYPEITPKDGYCPTAIPWTTDDLRWFHTQVQARGNTGLEREAKNNGAFFVNTFTPSKGHNACEAVGTRWIEPLFGSLTGVAVHPNALGEENDAFDVERSMLDHGVR
ncbi:MAG TPA: SGNH/GDSL hydrolase family protein [Solirubrobacteraceae bacterium]|nr:SGNH/GDSL hydrolase family protein [Solirubrobacteraceae bacterium]